MSTTQQRPHLGSRVDRNAAHKTHTPYGMRLVRPNLHFHSFRSPFYRDVIGGYRYIALHSQLFDSLIPAILWRKSPNVAHDLACPVEVKHDQLILDTHVTILHDFNHISNVRRNLQFLIHHLVPGHKVCIHPVYHENIVSRVGNICRSADIVFP